ncbi:MAG: R3H domain-containing nucleic acid-binding protein [Armatimonadota bacterium]|nr:R3H domain-containing nucleic acid-binding protein [Armatimonadota bacterium]
MKASSLGKTATPPVAQQTFTDELNALLDVLPPTIRQWLEEQPDLNELLEVVLDLGRMPEARFMKRTIRLEGVQVEDYDLQYVAERIGQFGKDNRAGIPRTLHRISAIRNRQGKIVGLTCRVGRAIYGTIDIIHDIIASGRSVLLLGKPGVGKTTRLREIARVLADEYDKRVIVVDTSNEIAGDGDIPHPGIGFARRMQVPEPSLQHAVMIEAVENHMPEVIIIDEIGTELEAYAARTIAERGVQLIGTAHGTTLENLLMNPTLSDLVGGIQTVTLSDEEARRRGTQKTVLERKAPPTFDVVIEILDFHRLAVHHDVAQTVDRMLRGVPPRPEIRVQTDHGFEVVQRSDLASRPMPQMYEAEPAEPAPTRTVAVVSGDTKRTPTRVFAYGVSRSRLEKALRELRLPAYTARDVSDADAMVVLHATFQRRPPKVREALQRNIPIAIVRSNTYAQLLNALRELFHKPQAGESAEERALREAEEGVEYVLATAEPYELSPQNSYLRRLQHQLIEKYRLLSESVGEEPNRRVRILPIYTDTQRED